MIFPSTAPWDGGEGPRGIENVVQMEAKEPGPVSRLLWGCWRILSTHLGRRE